MLLAKPLKNRFAWGEHNLFATRTFPAGKNEFEAPVQETMKITRSEIAVLINSRPAFKNSGSILLHFRELEGKPAELTLESKISGRAIKRMVEVNVIGEEIGKSIQSVKLNPFEGNLLSWIFKKTNRTSSSDKLSLFCLFFSHKTL